MRFLKSIQILVILSILASLIFPMFANKVCAETENEVTLNFEDGIIHDGYVEYTDIGKIQLFKDNEIVSNLYNDMKIDLGLANYKFEITKYNITENTGSAVSPGKVRLSINKWYYAIPDSGTFNLDTSKFYGTLNIKLERTYTVINTKVENNFTNLKPNATLDLSNEYVIDYSKNDELTNSLKLFADLEKTLYYKNENGELIETTNADEAIIKITGNKEANKAIITAVNVGSKKEEKLDNLIVKYTGSMLTYQKEDDGIIDEIKTNYYTICEYKFTFIYVKEEAKPIEYKVIEGANQTYTIGESNNATFRVNAEYNLFENGGKVYIDEALVDSKNYTSKSGSTIVTLTDAYLKTLSVGKHTLKVAFTDGGNATTKFKVAKKAEENNNGNSNNNENNSSNNNNNSNNNNSNSNNNGNNNSNTNNSSKTEIEDKKDSILNPQTGDNVVIYFILSTVCIIGIVTLVIIKLRKNKKES